MPLFTKVRIEKTDPTQFNLNQIQVKIYDLVRLILNKKLTDKISRTEMHERFAWSPFNHMSIMSVVCESWRLSQINILSDYINSEYTRETRNVSREVLKPNKNSENIPPFVNQCLRLLNHPKLTPVCSLNDNYHVRKFVLDCINYFPI